MAVRIPIITDFNGKGIQRAAAEFRQLEGIGAKTSFAIRKAMLPAAAAIGGLATAVVASVDAALKDQKAQVELARVLRNTLGATDDQIAKTEEWISVQGKTLGITDDDLRPAYAKLSRSIKDTTKVQKLLSLAFDISRGTGKDLGDTTDALAKAYNGNFKALKALAPELSGLIKDGATADQVFDALGKTFKNSAAEYANTAAGRMEILKLRFSELFEQLGTAFLPAFEKLMPYFEDLATWLENNPDKIADFASAVGKLAGAFVDFGKLVKDVFVDVMAGLEDIINFFLDGINKLIDGLNLLPGVNINKIEKLTRFNDMQRGPGAPPKQPRYESERPAGFIGPLMWDAYKPLPSGIQGPVLRLPGGYSNTSGFFGKMGTPTQNVTVNVNGGDPKAVVDAIVRWSRQNGRLPPQIQTAY